MEEIKEILKAPIEVLLVLAVLALVAVITKLVRSRHNGTERRSNIFTDEQRKYIDNGVEDHKQKLNSLKERVAVLEERVDGKRGS